MSSEVRDSPAPQLSDVQQRILCLVADGLTSADIAAAVHLTLAEVARQLTRVRSAFEVGSTGAAVAAAQGAGLLR